MPANIENFAKHRVRQSGDGRDWTVTDMLRDTLERIEKNELKPSMAVLTMAEEQEPGVNTFLVATAGASRLEAMGMLARHLQLMGDLS